MRLPPLRLPALTAALLILAGWGLGALVTAAHPQFDQELVDAVRVGPGLAPTMRVITYFGSTTWLDIVFAAAVVLLLLTRHAAQLWFLILASPGTVAIVQSVKALVGRPRPLGPHLTGAGGPSWPSGHASSSTALLGALLLIGWHNGWLRGPGGRAITGAVLALLALIGASRELLGVHFATDVLTSWLIVATWLAVLSRTVLRDPSVRSRGTS